MTKSISLGVSAAEGGQHTILKMVVIHGLCMAFTCRKIWHRAIHRPCITSVLCGLSFFIFLRSRGPEMGSKGVKMQNTVGIQRSSSIAIKIQSKFDETTTKRYVSARSFIWEGSQGPEMAKSAPKHKKVDFSEVVVSRRRRLCITGGPNPGCKDFLPLRGHHVTKKYMFLKCCRNWLLTWPKCVEFRAEFENGDDIAGID